MYIKKVMTIIGLSTLLVGCSTGSDYYSGSMQAQNVSPKTMGVRYLLGRGVPQNDVKAFYYFSKAANDGDPFAQSEIAYMYAAGKGTEQNYTQAVNWYQKAADQGLAGAQYNLGLLYMHGLGTPANKALAQEWFKKSAAHGFEPARQALMQS